MRVWPKTPKARRISVALLLLIALRLLRFFLVDARHRDIDARYFILIRRIAATRVGDFTFAQRGFIVIEQIVTVS
jgi:hypothetical protein